MRALLSFIVSTTSFASSLWAGVAAAAEPFNWSPQVDDPIHTPAELVESMHSAFGYNHSRAVHAKGIILQGEFTPDSHAKEITKAPHLQGPSSKVMVRFSDFSGVPTIPDNDPMASPRGLAIRFELPGGASTDVAAHSFNGLPVSDTDDLRDLMLAIAASGPCAATPTALDRFLEFHPTARGQNTRLRSKQCTDGNRDCRYVVQFLFEGIPTISERRTKCRLCCGKLKD